MIPDWVMDGWLVVCLVVLALTAWNLWKGRRARKGRQ